MYESMASDNAEWRSTACDAAICGWWQIIHVTNGVCGMQQCSDAADRFWGLLITMS